MNFARLNHILIPDTKDERDRFRDGRIGRLAAPIVKLYRALTTEGRFLAIFWLLSGAASVDVGGTRTYILWTLVSTLLFVCLMARRRYRMDDVRISISAAPEVVLGEVLPITIRLENRGASRMTAFRVQGPLLPWDGAYTDASPVVSVLDTGDVKHAVAKATFRARGEHHLDSFFVARVVPPGLSVGPSCATRGVRFVVVPRPAHVASLELRAPSQDEADGLRRVFGVNDDPEMAGIRPYRPGDRLRDLHARSWARVGYPVVREYELPVESRVAIRLGCGAGTTDALFEGSVELAAGIIQYLVARQISVDLAIPGADVGWLSINPGGIALGQAMQRLGCVQLGHVWPDGEPPTPPIGTSHTLVVRGCVTSGKQLAAASVLKGEHTFVVVPDSSPALSESLATHVALHSLHTDEGLAL